MEKDHMSEIVQNIRDLFRDVKDTETDPEGHAQGVEVLEEAKDVGEMAKLVKKLNEASKRLEVLREDLLEADRAIEACDAMTEDQVR
jgi:flagellar hook-associated protein FlgK